ncbi:MAG: hypothetical protein JWO31_4295, partial [Phycisphaerales bacterium]|nr:hypothetical protein [Phycisphaerales bacterium]
MNVDNAAVSGAVAEAAVPMTGDAHDFDSIVAAAGGARLVLLGEASHGTHEFYAARARITRRLVAEHGFTAVVVEADWPDAYRVNRFVGGDASGAAAGDDPDAEAALSGFARFPQWMWRNRDVLSFVRWLRRHNAAAAGDGPGGRSAGGSGSRPCGFYGMDLYSLYRSADAVLDYLGRTDPAAAAQARARYGCFERYDDDPQAYGR